MYTLSVSFADNVKDRVLISLAGSAGWTPQIRNPAYDSMYPDDEEETIANPETKEKAAQRYLNDIILAQIKIYETANEKKRISDLVDTEITFL